MQKLVDFITQSDGAPIEFSEQHKETLVKSLTTDEANKLIKRAFKLLKNETSDYAEYAPWYE